MEGTREPGVIFGPVSYLDCVTFCIFLAPQLIWKVGFIETTLCVLRALPFLLIQLPLGFIYERAFLRKKHQSPFVQRASLFEDFVIRCVRYAFANIKPNIGRVFLSKEVALRFLGWRMFRHGYLHPPIYWHEYHDSEDSFRGIWLVKNPMYKPDLVIYYAHGGGFSMGSSYFYLEFLMSWMSLLMSSGYLNPAIFALEYTLVPDASFPTQVHETIKGYAHVISVIGDSAGVVVSGDSAGATLMLILLLRIADGSAEANKGLKNRHCRLGNPGMAVLISPWTTLTSWRHKNTSSDYLNVKELHRYGLQFAGNNISKNDPLVSPGNCKDLDWWSRASPSQGFFVAYGKEEVLAPEIENLVQVLQKAGVVVDSKGEPGGIHAWPVASLFLSSTHDERLKGLRAITENISQRVGSLGLR